ncbi:MAG: SpoIIE family protein phosphatase, partial [Clostridia bacterium]
LGFILGYVLTSYLTSNFTMYSISITEVLIACFLVLLFPKKLEEKLTNYFTYNNKLDDNSVLLLQGSNVIDKLNVMSDIFDDLSINNLSSFDYIEETREAITKYLINYVNDNCYNCKNSSNCIEKNNISKSVELIISKLQNREVLDFDILDINCTKNDDLIKNINDIYSNIKIMKILKKQEEENSKKISKQSSNISDIISNISKDILNRSGSNKKTLSDLRSELKLYGYYIYEDDFKNSKNNIEYTIVTNILTDIDKQKKELISIVSNILETNMSIKLIMSASKTSKTKIKFVSSTKYIADSFVINNSKEEISGDSYLITNIENKHIIAISDGAGSGVKASKNSLSVINSLDKLLNNGFSNKIIIDIINNVINSKSDNDYATLDLCIIDLNNTDSIYVKYGANKTYIINKNKFTYINKENIPLGLLNEFSYIPISKKLEENDVIIQFSDGIVIEEELLKKININDTLDNISNYIINNSKCENDDVTLIVTKIKLNN